MKIFTDSRKFKATLDSLNPIREFLMNTGISVGLNNKRTYKLCLAVDEIASNIINYGYPDAEITKDDIEIIVFTEDEKLHVILEDSAMPFNPLEYEIPAREDLAKPLEKRPVGGLGMMLAKGNVDEFDYAYQNGKNKNIFRVKLK